ncbi:tyrosine-type recombinase/integrase [Methanocaldococcus fervens]|uniref:Integrase family protein n=1 Tax=Methanocaldococcus fervens (strain DSM 4213 / JCM 15782 / AG86) TaxID=573064 RepID=C7P9R2_METFA|nr:tyrosine-type recombinase/integrase [Methanocaldococcus fervens]ACV25419.1 integrase family protein [Methanocaldococcus fervens AG86]
MKAKWDKELDYEETKKELLNRLNYYRNKKPLYQKDKIAYTYILTGLLQLRNGCRIGEAVEGLIKIIQTNKREVKVRVEKRKDDAKRLIVLPDEITIEDLENIKEVVEEWEGKNLRRIANNMSKWFITNLGINTHSLRYAYISYLGKQNVPAQLIACITGHATLDMVLRYTQVRTAEEILKKWG